MRQASLWLHEVKSELGDKLKINWRSFLLEQVNADKGKTWKAWEQDDSYVSRGIWPLRGGVASRILGENDHDIFKETVMQLKHVEHQDIRSRQSVIDIASDIGLDKRKFVKYIDETATLESIVEDHKFAESMGVFGTPTIFNQNVGPIFLKMFSPPKDEAVTVFDHVIGISKNKKYFGELKRPQPPWPRGAVD